MPGTLILLATSTADKPTTFLILFFGQLLSWAGVPALGAAAMGTAGVLAHKGVVHLWAVLVIGTIGAEIGGMIGWWLGNRIARINLDGDGRFATRRRTALASGERFAERWGRFMVFFTPSWVPGALGMPFGQFARWNLVAAALWNIGAGLSAYGVASAIGGGSLLDSIPPLVIAAVALIAIFVLGLHHHHRRRDATTTAMAP